jgi:hypothetical protein
MSEMNLGMRLVVAMLATWRVTHLLANEDGPADIIVRLRAFLGHSVAGKLMDCFNCLSLWIAAPFALFVTRRPLHWLIGWLALSGGACLLQRLGDERENAPPDTSSVEDYENVLRPQAIGDANDAGSQSLDGVSERHVQRS